MAKIFPEKQQIWTLEPGDGYSIWDDREEAVAHGSIEDWGLQDYTPEAKTLFLVKEEDPYTCVGVPPAITRLCEDVCKLRFTNEELQTLSSKDVYYAFEELRLAIAAIKARYKQ